MRAFFFLVLVLCTFAAHADTQNQAAQPAVSPWQGTWKVRTQGLKPITGQFNGKEATITILQGGSTIKATLVDHNTLEYSGLRGHGTLRRRE